jgi:predicted ATPase
MRQLLGEARLVTLTGPPGAGKTRLAQEVARRALGEFEGGIWFVGLASLVDPELVLSTIAEALGVLSGSAGSPTEALTARLRDRATLLVLDNFEHLTAAATDIAELLEAAPALRILVTSRTSLHLSAEREYALPPLDLPQPEMTASDALRTDAVELFSRRATVAQPSFHVSEANAQDVVELCRRLDGLPLALELAAARVKLLPLPAILARVDHPLTLLTGGPRDLPARHQSLRAAVAWSYDLLDAAAQELFRRLSVFRGGWTIEGAAAAFADRPGDPESLLESLGVLLDSSLVARDPSEDADPRFTMLETLREFAADRLDDAGETDLVRARHANHHVALLEQLEPRFTGPNSASALNRVAREHDNIRAALAHFVDRDPEGALRLGSLIWRFWQMRGHLIEGDRWLGAALQAAGSGARDDVRADAYAAIGGLAYWRSDMAAARPHYEEALAIRRRIGDGVRTAGALYDLAFVFAPYFLPPPEDRDLTEQAMRLIREASELYRMAGDALGIARTGWLLGNLTLYRDTREGERLLRAAVQQFRGLNDLFGLGWALRMHGTALIGTLDTSAAGEELREALGLFAGADDGSALGLLLGDFSDLAAVEGDGLRAARLKGAAAGLRRVTQATLATVEQLPWLAPVPELESLIGPAEFEQAWAEGNAMSQTEAIAYALGTPADKGLDRDLRVTALGPFAVERSGERLTHWGGPKAGSRQAQAMFGFLFDRGERGVTKDEFIEVIWPDAEVNQGDLNFHRTLAGLRATLEPQKASEAANPVVFANGRYRLREALVGWDDVAEFERRLLQAARATDERAAIRGLEEARTLYRSDYLDDCPVYGDSEYVEERRTSLRGRLIDSLVDLGRRYERRGDETLAAARFREALRVAGGECPAATVGLERLGVAIA